MLTRGKHKFRLSLILTYWAKVWLPMYWAFSMILVNSNTRIPPGKKMIVNPTNYVIWYVKNIVSPRKDGDSERETIQIFTGLIFLCNLKDGLSMAFESFFVIICDFCSQKKHWIDSSWSLSKLLKLCNAAELCQCQAPSASPLTQRVPLEYEAP